MAFQAERRPRHLPDREHPTTPGVRLNIVLCHGAFDLLHYGHIEHFRAAKELGDFLVVSLSTNDVVAKRKPGRPIVSIAERAALVRSCRLVNQVWVCPTEDATAALFHWCPAYFVKGKDYDHPGSLSKREVETCRILGVQIAYSQTEKRSTTELVRKCKAAA